MAVEKSFDTTLANLFITICMNKRGKAAIVEGKIAFEIEFHEM